MIKGEKLEEAIRAEATRLGFVACGFAPADAADAAGLELKRWLEAGHHGTMGWMEARAQAASAPRKEAEARKATEGLLDTGALGRPRVYGPPRI